MYRCYLRRLWAQPPPILTTHAVHVGISHGHLRSFVVAWFGSTLIKQLVKDYPGDFGFSTSHTTRCPREGEIEGVDYHFADKAEMETSIANGEFLEHAHVHANIYGTSKAAVHAVTDMCQICILDIDIQVSVMRCLPSPLVLKKNSALGSGCARAASRVWRIAGG